MKCYAKRLVEEWQWANAVALRRNGCITSSIDARVRENKII